MKLSISNIAWDNGDNKKIYDLMRANGFSGLEIAPSKILNKPYDNINDALKWYQELKERFNFVISSMQSVWFGREEKMFASEKEREILFDYTKKAINFASELNCKNIVFGCPKNRNIKSEDDIEKALEFFGELGEIAHKNNTVIAIEANPVIYNTNFINDTKSAIDFVKKVNSGGILLNLDIGTMIYNEEKLRDVSLNVDLINHVHISEPYLEKIQERNLHKELINILKTNGYDKFISIEMKKQENISDIEKIMRYTGALI